MLLIPSARRKTQWNLYLTRRNEICTPLNRPDFSPNLSGKRGKAFRFTNAWEQRVLGDFLEVSMETNSSAKFDKNDVLSISGDYGVVNQIAFQGRSFASNSVVKYGVLHNEDIVYTKSPLKANPYGIIKTNKGKAGIVSPLYAIYHPKNNLVPSFVQSYFEGELSLQVQSLRKE